MTSAHARPDNVQDMGLVGMIPADTGLVIRSSPEEDASVDDGINIDCVVHGLAYQRRFRGLAFSGRQVVEGNIKNAIDGIFDALDIGAVFYAHHLF